MENMKLDNSNTLIESLPANSSWMTFFKTDYFGKNYFNFKGRASRREWWTTILMLWIFKILCNMICFIIANDIFSIIVYLFISVYFFIPNIAMDVRRCHDLNWSIKKILYPSIFLLLILLIAVLDDCLSDTLYLLFDHILGQIFLAAIYIIFIYWVFLILAVMFFKGDCKDNQFGKNIYMNK